jgi:hypothetical protein
MRALTVPLLAPQEVVKCTGKYTPLHQWLYLDAFDTLSTVAASPRAALSAPRDLLVHGPRAADAVALFGADVVAKLRSQVRACFCVFVTCLRCRRAYGLVSCA